MDAEKEIFKLKDGQSWTWPESDYGKAEIWLKNGTYFLFEIPQFGGEPFYVAAFVGKGRIGELVGTVNLWT